MLLITVDTSPDTGIFSLQKAFLLASLTFNKKEILFNTEGSGKVPALFKGKGFDYVENGDVRKLLKNDISLVIIFKNKLSGKDKKIVSKAKKKKIPIAKFSYMGENPIDTDLIIDPSPFIYNSEGREIKILSGPEYSIVDSKYIHFHEVKRKYNKKLKNILVAAGDSFPYRELRKLTETLINSGYKVKIIPGQNFKRFNRKTLKKIYPSLKISGYPESYARSFFEADLAIIDPEFSAVRASATGTPAIYLPQNDAGDTTASFFEEKGAGLTFRRWKKEDYSEILELLKFFSLEKREDMGNLGKELADGKGVYRLAEILKSFSKN
ncbi:MAG: hypothetical protein ABFR36_00875 [Acidobacteriota bacterium]